MFELSVFFSYFVDCDYGDLDISSLYLGKLLSLKQIFRWDLKPFTVPFSHKSRGGVWGENYGDLFSEGHFINMALS